MEFNQGPPLLPGFRFRPTEEHLLSYYLHKKVNGEAIWVPLAPPLSEIDFYNEEPWKIVQELGYSEEDSMNIDLYFFSRVMSKFSTGNKKKRTAGSGYWRIENTKTVTVRHEVIGVKKTLSFHLFNKSKVKGRGWVMHEYLLPYSLGVHPQGYEWVISRVKRGRITEDKSSCPPSHVSLSKTPVECLDNANQTYFQVQHNKRFRISDLSTPYAQASTSASGLLPSSNQQAQIHRLPQASTSTCGNNVQPEDQIAYEEGEYPVAELMAYCEDPEFCRQVNEYLDEFFPSSSPEA